MAHYMLKNGSYIQYGPKIIPNPNAEGSGGGGGGSQTYSVTVSLTNPINDDAFNSCTIYEQLSSDLHDRGDSLGNINSPSGSGEFSLDSSIYGIAVLCRGMSVDSDTDPVCAGDVTYIDKDYRGLWIFQVTGDGTITISDIDYEY